MSEEHVTKLVGYGLICVNINLTRPDSEEGQNTFKTRKRVN